MSGGNGVPAAAHRAAVQAQIDHTRRHLLEVSAALDELQIAASRASEQLVAAFRRLSEAERALAGEQEVRS